MSTLSPYNLAEMLHVRGEKRYTPGVAVVSARVSELNFRLDEARVNHRWLVMEQEAERGVVPPFRPPLLVDSVGLAPLVLAKILRDMSASVQPVPTVILVNSQDAVARHLALACRAAILVISESADLSLINSWLQVRPTTISGRWTTIPAAWVGVTPPPVVCGDVPLVEVLAALADAETMDEASDHACVSRRTFSYWRSSIRERLDLPTTQYRPLAFATDILNRLGQIAG